MSEELRDARETDESAPDDVAMDIALRKIVYGLAGDDVDPTECGVVEAAVHAVDRVETLEAENEALRQRVVELRDETQKMGRAADLYQDVSQRIAAKRDRQAGIILQHAARVSPAGREEYDAARIRDVLKAADEEIHRSNTYDVMDTAAEIVDDTSTCRVQKEDRSSKRNTRLIVSEPTTLPETVGGIRVHEGVLRE